MSWKKVKLGDFLKVRDIRFKPNDKAIADLKRIDKIDFSGEIFISDKPSNTDMILIKKGDLVISGINVEKGAMAVYTGDEDITATIHYSTYSFKENEIDIEFLKFFLKSSEFKTALKEQVPGGIKTEIKPKHLLPLEVDIPIDINDQREVVEILKSRNTKIGELSTELAYQIQLVKKLRQQLLQDAVQGKLVEQNPNDESANELLKRIKAEKAKLGKKEKALPPIKSEEIPFDIPENWVWCRLGEIIELVSGQDFAPTDYSDTDDDGTPYLTGASNLDDGKIILNRWTKTPKSIAYSGDLLLTCKGSGVGKNALFKAEKAHIARQLMAIRPFIIEIRYLQFIIQLQIEQFRSKAKSQIPGIDRDIVLLTKVSLPPLSEQKRIVAKIEREFAKIKQLEEHIIANKQATEKLLKVLLREAFGG